MVWKQTFPNMKQVGRTVFTITVNSCEISKSFLASEDNSDKILTPLSDFGQSFF